MLMNFYSFTFFIVSCFPLLCFAQDQEVFLISEHQSSSNIYLKKLIKREGETELVMQAVPADDISIYLYPPGDSRSIILRSYKTEFKLKDAAGIPFFPEMLEVAEGDTAVFSLFYNELPDDITELDIIERVEPFSDGFSFFNVKLSREAEQVKSIRFKTLEDFERYFDGRRNKKPLEGFWLVSKADEIVFKRKKWPPQVETVTESIALVFEENRLKAYYPDGREYGLEFKLLQDYLSLISSEFEEAEVSLTTDRKETLKLEAEWRRTKIVPPGMNKAKKARRTLKMSFSKASGRQDPDREND